MTSQNDVMTSYNVSMAKKTMTCTQEVRQCWGVFIHIIMEKHEFHANLEIIKIFPPANLFMIVSILIQLENGPLPVIPSLHKLDGKIGQPEQNSNF